MIKVIRTDAEHAAALEEIERLMGREPAAGTPEAEELGVLSLLVEDYESKRFPISHPDPIEAIKFRMEQQGLAQRDLVPYIGSPSRVSEVLARKRSLTLSMIRALHSGLGLPAESLLREHSASDFTSAKVNWNCFPFREMLRNGYFTIAPGTGAQDPEKLIRDFAEPHLKRRSTLALYKRTVGTTRSTDNYALAAWTMRVVTRGLERPLSIGFRQGSLTLDVMREVSQLSWSTQGPLLAQEFLERRGIPVIVEPRLLRTRLDGSAILVEERRPVIGLTLRYDRLDNFWFCLMHELAHISLHLRAAGESFHDDLENYDGDGDEREQEANRLAREALIPQDVWEQSAARFVRSPQAAQRLAEQLKIHPAIVVGRMQYESKDFRILGQLLGRGQVRRHFPHIKWRGKKP